MSRAMLFTPDLSPVGAVGIFHVRFGFNFGIGAVAPPTDLRSDFFRQNLPHSYTVHVTLLQQ